MYGYGFNEDCFLFFKGEENGFPDSTGDPLSGK